MPNGAVLKRPQAVARDAEKTSRWRTDGGWCALDCAPYLALGPFAFVACLEACLGGDDYGFNEVPDDIDDPSKDPCEAYDHKITIRAISWENASTQSQPLWCEPSVSLDGAGGGSARGGSRRAPLTGDLGNGLHSSAPDALLASTCSTNCPTRMEFDTQAGVIWTYISAVRDPDYAPPDIGLPSSLSGAYDHCAAFFDYYDAMDATQCYFVNAFIPYLCYDYRLEYDVECGLVMRVRFWAGMINNFSAFAILDTGERLFMDEMVTGASNTFVPYAWIGWRAFMWFSGIQRTRARIRTARESDGGYAVAEDSREWSCDLSGVDGWVTGDACSATLWEDDGNFFRYRDLSARRNSDLGNMLRGEVVFSNAYSTSHTYDELVAEAYSLLFGRTIQFEQEMDYHAGEGDVGSEQTAKVRACLTFADAETRPDCLARIQAINATNPQVFQTEDRANLSSDTFDDFPAGWSINLSSCDFYGTS